MRSMERRRLGRTDFTVSRIALGCGNFGGIGSAPELFGRGTSRREAFAIMDEAVELGITLLDTADAYGGGRSEEYIGRWLRSRGPGTRDRVEITTKVFHSVVGDPHDRGLAPARIATQIDGSLARLGVDCVDLYLTHEPDPATPLDETLGALDALVRAGKIRAFGLSNVTAGELGEAVRLAQAGGRRRVECVQNELSLLEQAAADELLGACARHQIAFTAFSPLAGGWLTAKYRRGAKPPPGSRMTLRPGPYERLRADATFSALARFEDAARERRVEPAALALAWLLGDARVTSIVVGPRRAGHLAPVGTALELHLSDGERAALAGLFR